MLQTVILQYFTIFLQGLIAWALIFYYYFTILNTGYIQFANEMTFELQTILLIDLSRFFSIKY